MRADREVEKIVQQAKEMKRNITRGIYCNVMYCIYVCQKGRNVFLNVFICSVAIRTVAAGHRMIVEGWDMFEEAVDEAGESCHSS